MGTAAFASVPFAFLLGLLRSRVQRAGAVSELLVALREEISDDGMGGADPDRGSGLAGLSDRISAVDGRLDVHSPPGRGTRLRAEIPYDVVRSSTPVPAP